jgi:PilZ domain
MEQRRTKRFDLELPLAIVRTGTERVSLAGFTKNISSTGVLFTSGTAADPGGPIEYVIKLNDVAPQPVSLRCVGKVVRSVPMYATGGNRLSFTIAATLERYEFVREPHLSLLTAR